MKTNRQKAEDIMAGRDPKWGRHYTEGNTEEKKNAYQEVMRLLNLPDDPADQPPARQEGETPRTDAAAKIAVEFGHPQDQREYLSTFARSLERELSAKQAEVERLLTNFADLEAGRATLMDLAVRNGTLTADIGSETCGIIAARFAELLKEKGGENYLEMHFKDPREDGERLVLTLQWHKGKSPHELRREAESELESLKAAQGWKNIESAPKGGGAEYVTDPKWIDPPCVLLLFDEGKQAVCYWDWFYAENGAGYVEGRSAWTEQCSGDQVAIHFMEPIGWMPLPTPPVDSKQQKS